MTVKVWQLGLVCFCLLLAVAVYLGPRPASSASDRAAAIAQLGVVVPEVALYRARNIPNGPSDPDFMAPGPTLTSHASGGHDRGYTGMTAELLASNFRPGLPVLHGVWVNPADPGFPVGVRGVKPTVSHFCAVARSGGWYAWKLGPGGRVQSSTLPGVVCQVPGYSP